MTKKKTTKKKKSTAKKKKSSATKAQPLSPSTTKDALREAVLRARGDSATLQVWADALLERGDPRGELIQLEQQKPSAARDQLIAAHIRKHGRALLGDLGSVLMVNDHVAFDRGFLSECAIATDSRSKIKAVIGHPDWATVRSIYFRNYKGAAISPLEETKPHPAIELLLQQSLARSLEVALGIGLIDVFAVLAESPTPLALKEVYLIDYNREAEDQPKLQKTIASSKAFPHLHRLGFEGLLPDFIFAAEWAKQLDTIDTEIQGRMVRDALAVIEEKAPQVHTVVSRPDRVFENGFDRPEWIYTFKKKGKRFASVEVTSRAHVGGGNLHGKNGDPPDPKQRAFFLKALPRALVINARGDA